MVKRCEAGSLIDNECHLHAAWVSYLTEELECIKGGASTLSDDVLCWFS